MKDPVTFAVAQCPFLAKVAAQNGNDYARSIAINPTEVAGAPAGPDSLKQYEASFQMFHGPSGIVPLVHSTINTKPVSGGVCPFHAQRAAAAAASEAAPSSVTSSQPLPRALPLATISLSFGAGSNFGDFLRNQLHNKSHSKKRPPQQHRQPPSSNSSHLTNSSSTGPGPGYNPTNTNPHGPSAGNPSSGSFNKPQRPLTDPTGSSTSSSSSARSSGFGSSSTSKGLQGLGGGPSGAGSGLNLNPGSPGMQNPAAAAAASGTTGVNPTSAASPSTFSSGSSIGGAGCSGSSSSAAGLRGFSSSSGGGINGPGHGSSPYKSSVGSSSSSGGGLMGRNNTRSGLTSSSTRVPVKGTGGAARGPKPPGSTSSKIASSSSSAASPSPCPLRKWLGPFAGVVFNEYDKIVCPAPIVAARAALASTAAVQQLRPQQLPVKLVAVAAVAAAANLPAGAVREHFEKFSLGWFIAVHATIPFVAMLRKAVIMPKYSILVTIASAVIGQMVGSRLERARLQYQQAAVAAQIAGSPIAASSSSSGAGSLSKVVRDSSWREKLIAGGVAGFNDPDQDSNPTAAAVGAAAAAAAAACGAGLVGNSGGVVGLGSLFAKLPVVKA